MANASAANEQGEQAASRVAALMTWYRQHFRQLPWRPPPGQLGNPYHVLVSEAMLQQTQVATVIDYFHRFIERFPTLAELATADEQAVLTAWQGLGYYRRARNLHAAAKAIVAQHGGKAPADVASLRALPGIGRYTAGAIASIAYGTQTPVVDGNVTRVLTRWFAIEESVSDRETEKRVWSLAERLVPADDAGDFNQAMMELGATVCRPKRPHCLTCPVAKWCEAARRGIAESLPRKAPRRPPTPYVHHVVAIRKRGRWLFAQRPETGLWSRMWHLPTIEAPMASDATGPPELSAWIEGAFGLVVDPPVEHGRFKHATTHRAIEFRLWVTDAVSGRLKPASGKWRGLAALDEIALPNPYRKIVALLGDMR